MILKENDQDIVYPLNMHIKMNHPQYFLHPKNGLQHWIVSVIEALKYWLDPKATQVPKDQVELFSDYY